MFSTNRRTRRHTLARVAAIGAISVCGLTAVAIPADAQPRPTRSWRTRTASACGRSPARVLAS